MQTNFFKTLTGFQLEGDWQIIVKAAAGDRMLVSVLFTNEKTGDNARKIIPPLILKGSARELDEGFFPSIEAPVKKTASLFVNMEQYAKAQEEARLQSREQQDKIKKEKDKARAEQREGGESDKRENKKYEVQMKKVTDLESAGKYGEAIGQLPKADQYPEYTEAIEKRLADLKVKGGFIL